MGEFIWANIKKEISKMRKYRIVDLSVKLHPGREERRLETRLITFKHTEKIMMEIDTMTHIGTHVEAHLHLGKGGDDASQIPLDVVVGPAVYLKISNLELKEEIHADHLEKAGGGKKVQKGDIVLLGTDSFDHIDMADRPVLMADAGKWLVNKGVKCVGYDTHLVPDIRGRKHEEQLHTILMEEAKIPMIEELTNLDQLREQRFFFIGAPLKIESLDSSPIRAIAIEGLI